MSQEETTSYKVSRKHITCDAPNCNREAPAKRCSRCRLVYYCSMDCARAHWGTHRPECVPIEEMKQKMAGLKCEEILKEELEDKESVSAETLTQQCAICFEEFGNVPNTVTLKCGHVFCFKCLTDYQKYSIEPPSYENQSDDSTDRFPSEEEMLESIQRNQERREGRGPGTTCPMCRAEMPNLRESTMNKISLFISQMHTLATNENQDTRRTEASKETQDKLDHLHQRALDEMQALYHLKEDKMDFQLDCFNCQALHMKGDNEASIDFYLKVLPVAVEAVKRHKVLDSMMQRVELSNDEEEVDQLLTQIHHKANSEGFSMTDADLVELILNMNEVRKGLGDWRGAFNDLKTLLIEHPDQDSLSPVQWRKIFMGMSQCLYECGDYQKSVDSGMMSVEMNRHFPGVYSFVGKSYQALEDLESADRMFSQAILYETPWDEENIARAQRQYDDFRRETNLES